MIGIKGMELPKNAETCRFRHSIYDWCVIDKKPLKRNKSDKCLVCPLVDLGKEDMSWEELVEKVKELKGVNIDTIKNRIYLSKFNISFEKTGEIYLSFGTSQLYITIKDKIKPFKMYQIIKSLVGDER